MFSFFGGVRRLLGQKKVPRIASEAMINPESHIHNELIWNEPGEAEIMMRFYSFVRSEVSESFRSRDQVLTFSISALSTVYLGTLAFFGGVLASKNLDSLPSVVFVIFRSTTSIMIPLLSLFFMIIFLGEIVRMTRAGEYLYTIEKGLDAELKSGYGKSGLYARMQSIYGVNLFWEAYLKRNKLKMQWNYVMMLGLYPGISLMPSLVNIILTPYLGKNDVLSELSWLGFIICLIQILIGAVTSRSLFLHDSM